VLHFIALPYFVRVNTSKNKKRLVGQGWCDLLMNSIRSVNISFPWRRNNNVIPSEQVKYDVSNDICIISTKIQQQDSRNQHLSETRLECNLNVPNNNNPSTSKGYGKSKHGTIQASISSTNNVRSSGRQREFIVNRNKLISDLSLNINDEKVYLRLFIRLTNLETVNYEEQITNISNMENDQMLLGMVQKLLRKGPTHSRTPERREILQTLHSYQEEDDVYKEHLERFINMEEHFLADEFETNMY
jgi:hypothetical protein